MTRILHVINMGATCGGAERMVADLARAQRAAGHQVQVLTSDLPGSGARFSDLTWRQADLPGGPVRRAIRLFGSRSAQRALRSVVTAWRPDVVHLHTVGLLSPAALRTLASVPTVLTVHGPEIYLPGTVRWCIGQHHRTATAPRPRLTPRGWLSFLALTLLIGPLWRRALRVVDVCTVPSRFMEGIVAPFLPRIRVVHNSLDPGPGDAAGALVGAGAGTVVGALAGAGAGAFVGSGSGAASAVAAEVTAYPTDLAAQPADPAAYPAEAAAPRLLFFGRLERAKGVQTLISAVARVLPDHPGAVLTIAGAGPQAAALARLSAELGIADRVRMTGWLSPEEITAELARTDVVVVPSHCPEAFGLTCLQALSAGRAVIATTTGGLPELIRHDQTGLLVPPADVDALSSALHRLLADRTLRVRLGQAGRRFSTGFTLAAHLTAMAEAYREATGPLPGPRPEPGPAASHPGTGTSRLVAAARRWTTDSLLRNSALLTLSTVLLAAGGFFFWQTVARLFPPAVVGYAGAMISAATLIGNLALLGMNNSLIRYLDAWPNRARTLNTGATVVLSASALGGLVFVLAGGLAPGGAGRAGPAGPTMDALVFVGLTTVGALSMLYDTVFVALRRTDHLLSRNAAAVLLRLAAPPLLIGLHATGIFGAYWGAMLLTLPLYLSRLRVFGLAGRPALSRYRLRAMWRYSAGSFLASTILMAPNLLMPVLVAHLVGPDEAAYYYISALLASGLQFVPMAASRSMFAEAAHDPAGLCGYLHRVLRLGAISQAPLLAVLLLFGAPLLGLFGHSYRQAYPLLVMLTMTSVLASVCMVGSTLLLISGQTRRLCRRSAAAYLVTLLGAGLLGPQGTLWIAGSAMLGELLLAGGYLPVIRQAMRGEPAAAHRAGGPARSGACR